MEDSIRKRARKVFAKKLILKEGSFFFGEEDINKILDKISEVGYENLDASDKAILKNYSNNDEDIKSVILAKRKLEKEHEKVNKEMDAILKGGCSTRETQPYVDAWVELRSKIKNYEDILEKTYKIKDPALIYNFEKKYIS